MGRTIDKYSDIVDSRDIIKRIEALEDERDSFTVDPPEGAAEDWEPTDEEREDAWELACPEDAAELAELEALAEEASDSPDWKYGETLIRRSYFVEYTKRLAEDLGSIKGDETWPFNFIDWDAAAEALEQDYFEVNWGGEEFLIRS